MGEAKRKQKAHLNELRARPHRFAGIVDDLDPWHCGIAETKDAQLFEIIGDESSAKGLVIK